MARKLDFTLGTIHNSRRAAAILAIKEKDDVTFEFNGAEHTLTLAEAQKLLPELVAETFQKLSNFKALFNRHLDILQKDLLDIIEVSLLS